MEPAYQKFLSHIYKKEKNKEKQRKTLTKKSTQKIEILTSLIKPFPIKHIQLGLCCLNITLKNQKSSDVVDKE